MAGVQRHITPSHRSGKLVGLVGWADGVQASQGIDALDGVAQALRAWMLTEGPATQD